MHNDAQIVVFACQKGGSGKTTLSGHIAVEAERAGAGPVALVDTDPQGSLAKWWNARESQLPAFAQISVAELHRDIKRLRQSGFKLIVIDTPPAITTSIAEVISHADLVVLPSRPSPHDLRAVGPTVDIVEHQHKPLVFVINAATARARITGETAVALSQHGTVAPVTIHQRVDFAASMIDGRTVGEVDVNSRSAREIADLWGYLDSRLARLRTDKPLIEADPLETWEDGVLTPMAADHGEEAPSPPAAPEPFFDTPAVRHLPEHRPPEHRSELPPAHLASPFAGSEPPTPVEIIAALARANRQDLDRDRDSEPPAAGSQQPQEAANGNWDGVDRRKKEMGPPSGMLDRRRARGFGRRESA